MDTNDKQWLKEIDVELLYQAIIQTVGKNAWFVIAKNYNDLKGEYNDY